MEFDLINASTNGKFYETVNKHAALVEERKYIGVLSDSDRAAINRLFGFAMSADEDNIRRTDFMVALNFAVADRRYDPVTARNEKIWYINSVRNRSIPFYGRDKGRSKFVAVN